MIKKVLLFLSATVLMICPSFASVNNTITSKGYVDTEIETKQLKIPAAGAPNVGIGDSVITYTNTDGSLGERGVYTGANDYDATSDSDKLITASALNSAFTTLPTLETNRLVCANPGTCDLWTITPQTAYGNSSGGGINVQEFLDAMRYGEMVDDCLNGFGTDCDGTDVSVAYTYNDQTFRISVDAAVAGGDGQQVAHSCTGDGYCYCRLASPDIPNPQWIRATSYGSPMNCDDSEDCPYFCEKSLENEGFVRSLFGVQQ